MPWWIPGAVVLVFGLLTCLRGYKILKLVLFSLGLITGAYAALLYAPLIFPESPKVVWILAAVLGLALGILMNFFYKAGVFIMGAYVAGVFLLPFLQSMQEFAAIGVLILAIVVGGFIALKLEQWAMKIATACIGAWHVVQSTFYLLKLSPFLFPWEQILDKYGGASLHDIFNRPWYFWTGVVVLALAGLVSQMKRKKSE